MARRSLIFITSILYVLCLWGQSPGGVPGAELWQVATPTTVYLDSTYYWKDLSGDAVITHESGSANIEFKQARRFMQAFNFNPAFHFKLLSADSIISNLKHTNLSQATILGVFAPSHHLSQESRIYDVNGRDGEGFSVYKSSIVRESGSLQYGSGSTLNLLADNENDAIFRESALRTLSYQRSLVPNHSVWGESKESSIIFPANNDSSFIFCPEIIAYGRELSNYERRKVESYLAIKYGITLRGSFYAPDSTLIWDSQSNETYNHRVASIANYSNSKLFQPLSTTSYEELPNCAIDSLCDSYYLRSSYNKPTSNRLLVMGREHGSPMPDNSYMIWGDNNSYLNIATNQTDTLWRVMNRKWELFSNLPYETSDTVPIVSSNINVVKVKEGVFNISRNTSSRVSDITFGHNTSNDLHFSFTCPNNYPAFEVLIKPTSGTSNYGFKFNSNGSVYTVNGRNSTNVYADARNRKIDIYKRGDNLFLQVDGVGDNSMILVVPVLTFVPFEPLESGLQPNGGGTGIGDPIVIEPDISPNPGYRCKGALHVYGGGSLLLSNFHVDGFCNTHNQVELNFNLASDLKRYRNKRTFMLIGTDEDLDPTDTRTRAFRCSEFDSRRHKTIFHNVSFKDDSTQYFTFATYDGFDVDLNPISATCVNGVSQNNGKLEIDIKYGTPLFKYSLTPFIHNEATDNMNLQQVLNYHMNSIAQNPEDVRTGWFNDMNYTLTDISPGDYYFQLDQLGGANVYASPFVGSNSRYASCGNNVSFVSWQLSDELSVYNAGFGTSEGNISIGFEINGRECYTYKGNQRDFICDDLSIGEVLTVELSDGNVVLSRGGRTVKTYSSGLQLNVFSALFNNSESTLSNVICRDDNDVDLNAYLHESDESVVIDSIRPLFINAIVNIADCDGESEVQMQPNNRNYVMHNYNLPSIGDFSSDKGKLTVTPDGYRNYNAELRTKDTESAQLLVFDATGRLITQTNMSPGEVKYANFSVPGSGVYIVKVLTSDDEYTWKLLSE